MRTAIIVIPLAIEMDEDVDFEELCEDIDRTVALNIEAAYEHWDASDEQKEKIRKKIKVMNTTVLCYVNWG